MRIAVTILVLSAMSSICAQESKKQTWGDAVEKFETEISKNFEKDVQFEIIRVKSGIESLLGGKCRFYIVKESNGSEKAHLLNIDGKSKDLEEIDDLVTIMKDTKTKISEEEDAETFAILCQRLHPAFLKDENTTESMFYFSSLNGKQADTKADATKTKEGWKVSVKSAGKVSSWIFKTGKDGLVSDIKLNVPKSEFKFGEMGEFRFEFQDFFNDHGDIFKRFKEESEEKDKDDEED